MLFLSTRVSDITVESMVEIGIPVLIGITFIALIFWWMAKSKRDAEDNAQPLRFSSARVVDKQLVAPNMIVFEVWVLFETEEGERVRVFCPANNDYVVGDKGRLAWRGSKLYSFELKNKEPADETLKRKLEGDLCSTEEELGRHEDDGVEQGEDRTVEMIYYEACMLQSEDLEKAAQLFEQISYYRDSSERARVCCQRLVTDAEKANSTKCEGGSEDQCQKKNKKVRVKCLSICLMVFFALVVILTNWMNDGKEQWIEKCLVGRTFVGTRDQYGGHISNGSWGLYEERVQYEDTYRFMGDGRVEVYSVKRYDEAPFTTINGEVDWDSQTSYTKTIEGGAIRMSIFGAVSVYIDGVYYDMKVDEDDIPISFVIKDTIYCIE